MMISTKGRYALRVMTDLAQRKDDGFISIHSIAERQNISPKYLEALMSILLKAGFVESRRGKSGGYKLSRTPSSYSVGSILRLVEGQIVSVNCSSIINGTGKCTKSSGCLTLPLWGELQELIDNFLDGKTLQDLIK